MSQTTARPAGSVGRRLDPPRISAVIPAWNAAAWLGRAIQSALAQELPPVEVIVVDDGSEDGTAGIASSFGPPVRLLRAPHRGQAAATNTGVMEAAGEFVAILHADDEWLPEKSGLQVEALKRVSGAGIAYCDLWLFDLEGAAHGRFLPQKSFASEGDVFDALLEQCFVLPSASLIRAGLFRERGLRFAEDLRSCLDYDFWLRAARICPFARIDQPLVRRTLRPEAAGNQLDAVRRDHVVLMRRLRRELIEEGKAAGRSLKILDRRLAGFERQLGAEHYRAGEYPAALDLFRASFRRRPSMGAAGMLLAGAAGPGGKRMLDWVRGRKR